MSVEGKVKYVRLGKSGLRGKAITHMLELLHD